MKNKTYDKVLDILIRFPETRNSDKILLVKFWIGEGVIQDTGLFETYSFNMLDFSEATSAESVTRARRKVQELHPELRPNNKVAQYRKEIENTKGTFIFQ